VGDVEDVSRASCFAAFHFPANMKNLLFASLAMLSTLNPLAAAQLFWDGSGNWVSVGPGSGGSGTWQDGVGSWNPASQAVFGGAAGNVTASGTVTTSNGMLFVSSGYLLSGGAISLGGATALANSLGVTNSASATISSGLSGSAGFTKAGSGTLVLSASNSFTGNATISAGTLQIASDNALGNVANDITNNGTLKTTASIALDAGRNINGSGAYDLAGSTTLMVNGAISNTATTLANTGTLNLQGATRSLGVITLNAAGTINAVGAINASGLTAPGVSSGTATINPDIVFTSGDKTLNVAAGGTVDLNGALSNGGGSGRILKTGSGTLILSGANTMGGLRVGAAGAAPTDGGTVVLENTAIGTLAQAIQVNYGTLRAASNLVFTNGLSIAGRSGAAALLAGNNLEFQGQSAFVRANGTSDGELVLNVDNVTTFSGGFAATSGSATATGITIGGSGQVVISGSSAALEENITLTDTVKLTLNNAIGGGLTVGGSNVLAGNGTVGGSLSFLNGGKFELNLLSPTLTVNGTSVTFSNFGMDDIVGLDSSTPLGTYTLFAGSATVDTNNLSNLGVENAFSLGGEKSAYFSVGSLELNVVPEPSTYALLILSAAGLGAHIIRRRRR